MMVIVLLTRVAGVVFRVCSIRLCAINGYLRLCICSESGDWISSEKAMLSYHPANVRAVKLDSAVCVIESIRF